MSYRSHHLFRSFCQCIASFWAIWIALQANLACAQGVPSLINYQGRLSESNGAALATADYQLTFNIYDSASGGNLVWGPQIFDGSAGQGHGSKIPVVQGYFNVILGPSDSSSRALTDAFTNSPRFVEIKVGANLAIVPRQQILSAPFALNSSKLAGADWSAVFGTNDPVNGKVPTSKLATNGTIIAQQIGVGTSSPQAPLHIRSDAAYPHLRVEAGPNAPFGAFFDLDASGIAGGKLYRAYSTGASASEGQGKLVFQNYSDARIVETFTSDGNVGIGTTSPSQRLSIAGGIGFSGANLNETDKKLYSPADGVLEWMANDNGAAHGFAVSHQGQQRVFLNTLGTSYINGGNVGIGTASPQYKLDVAGSLAVNDTINFPGSVGRLASVNALTIQAGPGQGLFLNPFAGAGVVQVGGVGGTGDMNVAGTLSVTGNLGVGTASPSQKLEVNGIIGATSGYKCRSGGTGTYGANVFNFMWFGTNIGAYIDNSYVGNIVNVSDRRLKEEIRPMRESALERVLELKPVSFKYKAIPNSIFVGGPGTNEGFVADELQEVIPSAVTGVKGALTSDGKIQPQTLNLAPVVAVLTKAMQEQQKMIRKQQNRLEERDAEIEQLKLKAGRIDALEERLRKLEAVAAPKVADN